MQSIAYHNFAGIVYHQKVILYIIRLTEYIPEGVTRYNKDKPLLMIYRCFLNG